VNLETTRDPSVAMLLELHHRRLDDMFDEIELMAEAQRWQEARRVFEDFRRELEAHIRLEEELMFPTFESDAPTLRGPMMVMRAEHAAIRAFLTEVAGALAEERAARRAMAELEAQLDAHNVKEERVLYPAFERTAPPSVRAALAAEVEALLQGPG
jgi:regulator of cell morphogenesis and NO signaling